VIAAIAAGDSDAATAAVVEAGLLKRRKDGTFIASRERRELESKLAVFGLEPPWCTTVTPL
jgi:hypothetical protein